MPILRMSFFPGSTTLKGLSSEMFWAKTRTRQGILCVDCTVVGRLKNKLETRAVVMGNIEVRLGYGFVVCLLLRYDMPRKNNQGGGIMDAWRVYPWTKRTYARGYVFSMRPDKLCAV